ncbi:MAG: hypothetical protein KGL16_03785, partial [Acidobacteriota bacterium]|nr:hypothetical protein [Acidobacteriota bacterium]
SPNGVFTTPKLGTIAFGARASVAGHKAMIKVVVRSGFKASGTVALMIGRKKVGSGRFSLAAHATGNMTVTLTKAGVAAAQANKTAKLVLTSNWDQPAATKSVKL